MLNLINKLSPYLGIESRRRIDKGVAFGFTLFSVLCALASIYQFLQFPFKIIAFYAIVAGLSFIGVSWYLFQLARCYDTHCWVGIIFLAALLVRVGVVIFSPFTNLFVDIGSDQDMGQLIANGINSYNFNDGVALRSQFRLDERAYNFFSAKSQANWNYHAGGHLPFFELLMGYTELLYPSLYTYRFVFAWVDSLVCVGVLLIVSRHWVLPSYGYFRQKMGLVGLGNAHLMVLVAVAISVISPIFIRSGTLIPNFKGTLTFLMLAAVFFSYQTAYRQRVVLSAVFLGFSVAFMAMGFLAIPLIARNLYQRAASRSQFFFDFALYSLFALVSCFVWFLPFYEYILPMIQNRLGHGTTLPIHGSIWRFANLLTPQYWQTVKSVVVGLFIVVHLVGIWRKKLSLEVITASLFFLFLQLLTTDGSMDRLNIALMMCICLYGISERSVYYTLVPLYFLGGAMSVAVSLWVGAFEKSFGYEPFEYSLTDSVFNTVFLVVYLCLITSISFANSEKPQLANLQGREN